MSRRCIACRSTGCRFMLGAMLSPAIRYKRHFGPYRTPRFKVGSVVQDEIRGRVKIIGVSDGRIPWPLAMNWTHRSLVVYRGLARALRLETLQAVVVLVGRIRGTNQNPPAGVGNSNFHCRDGAGAKAAHSDPCLPPHAAQSVGEGEQPGEAGCQQQGAACPVPSEGRGPLTVDTCDQRVSIRRPVPPLDRQGTRAADNAFGSSDHGTNRPHATRHLSAAPET